MKKPVVVVVSGGFDPIHIGHIELFTEAKALGDKLVVLVNNDHWIKIKKDHPFMPERERAAIIEALEVVDQVVLTDHKAGNYKAGSKDYSVANELLKIKPDIFAQGGDRSGASGEESFEEQAVKSYGGKVVYGIGKSGKIQSSSWLLENYLKNQASKAR